jgi:hypothetical protein
MRTRSSIAALMAVASLVGASGAVAKLTLGDSSPASDPISAERAAAELAPTASAFQRSQTAGEKADGIDMRAAAAETRDDVPGENIALQRRASGIGWPTTAAVWPADGSVCMAVGGAGICTSVDAIERQGVVTVLDARDAQSGRPLRLAGLVRSDVETVYVETDAGRTRVEAGDGAFVVDLDSPPTGLEWVTAPGATGRAVVADGPGGPSGEPLVDTPR